MKKTAILLGAFAVLAAGYGALSQPAPSGVIGCVYNAVLPTLANRQTTTLQCDSAGQLILAP